VGDVADALAGMIVGAYQAFSATNLVIISGVRNLGYL